MMIDRCLTIVLKLCNSRSQRAEAELAMDTSDFVTDDADLDGEDGGSSGEE
jgi:hypothetical protein